MKQIIFLLILAASAFPQTTFTLPSVAPGEPALSVTVSATGVSNLTSWIASIAPTNGWPNFAGLPSNTTLSADLTLNATSVSLASGTNLTTCNGILIDSEVIAVVSGTGPFTVIRGSAGTSKATHTAGSTVTVLRSGNYTCWLKMAWADALTGVTNAKLQGVALTTQTRAKSDADIAISAVVSQVVQ